MYGQGEEGTRVIGLGKRVHNIRLKRFGLKRRVHDTGLDWGGGYMTLDWGRGWDGTGVPFYGEE